MVLFTVAALTAAKVGTSLYYVSKDEKDHIHSWPRLSRRSATLLRSQLNKRHQIGDGTRDVSQEEVSAKALELWGPKDSEDWKKIEAHRPYYLEGHKPTSPSEGDTAPDGEVLLVDGGEDTLYRMMDRVAEAAGTEHVALFFVSATCPSSRFYGPLFQKAAKDAGIPILFVLILEAHAQDEFPLPSVNEKWPYALREQIDQHRTRQDRANAGKKLRYHFTQTSPNHEAAAYEMVPMVMDPMSNALEAAYEARPMRFYVVNARSKTVALKTGLGPFNIPAKIEKLSAKFQPEPTAEDDKDGEPTVSGLRARLEALKRRAGSETSEDSALDERLTKYYIELNALTPLSDDKLTPRKTHLRKKIATIQNSPVVQAIPTFTIANKHDKTAA